MQTNLNLVEIGRKKYNITIYFSYCLAYIIPFIFVDFPVAIIELSVRQESEHAYMWKEANCTVGKSTLSCVRLVPKVSQVNPIEANLIQPKFAFSILMQRLFF